MILDSINNVNDIKKIKKKDYDELAREIRLFLVENVSRTGGHLASNLGIVELTMALHLSLDLRKDRIVFDVGHQSYVHKILTGRKDRFGTLRQYGGLSGFPKTRESEYDAFNTGHSSTSISAALGLAHAAKAMGDDSTIVAVIGDGAFTGGLALEALNNISKLRRNFIVILNDNNMSISENVGGLSSYLSNIRSGGFYNSIKNGVVNTLEMIPGVGDRLVRSIKKTKDDIKKVIIPGAIFEEFGLTYLGPYDGHNVSLMRRVITEAKKLDHPVLIHVITKKGKGYRPAELHPDVFHGIGRFNIRTGKPLSKSAGPTWTQVFSEAITEAAHDDPKIFAITAAMTDGTGLKTFAGMFPERFFDVGIAEEHAVTFAAGLARGGMKPFVAIYSSFLQRAYDEMIHDVCIQGLPVVFCIDRAGLVGEDGETHNGTMDLSYLNTIPGMNIIAPMNDRELADSIRFAAGFNAPLAIRYGRGEAFTGLEEFSSPIVYGKSTVIYEEKDIAILSVGSMMPTALEVRERLKAAGRNVTLVNVRFVKPIDEECIEKLCATHDTFITLEENIFTAGFGMMAEKVIRRIDPEAKTVIFSVPNLYIEQGSRAEQLKECALDADSIMERLSRELS